MDIRACRVCGFIDADGELPWGKDGGSPTFDYCACCGVEFGYQDSDYESMKAYRRRWLHGGAKWDDEIAMPADWNVAEQLATVSPDEESLQLAIALLRDSTKSA